jgi:hypothetical protein
LKGPGYDTANVFAEKVTPDEFVRLFPCLPTAFSPATESRKVRPVRAFLFFERFFRYA